jgi:hypothetical protein
VNATVTGVHNDCVPVSVITSNACCAAVPPPVTANCSVSRPDDASAEIEFDGMQEEFVEFALVDIAF